MSSAAIATPSMPLCLTPAACCAQVVAGRHCLMIDDLCDSGLTLMSVRDKLLEAGAASVKSVVLLDKRARRKVREQEQREQGFEAQVQHGAGRARGLGPG